MKTPRLRLALAALAIASAMASTPAFADGICIDPNGARCAASFSIVDWFAGLFSSAQGGDGGMGIDPNGRT
jgi:hypothetical protein